MARPSWGCFLTVLPLWLHIVGIFGAYVMVEDDTGIQGYVKWPNCEIKYCYETEAAREKFHKDLMDAWEIWLTTGLNEAFTITEVDAQTCTNDKVNTMLIYDSDMGPAPNGVLGTVPGFLGAGNRARGSSGYYTRKNRPIMALTDRDDIGMLNPVFNYAHEWGHAWGLYHEHQNPNFWDGVVGAKSGKVFGIDNKVEYDGASIDNWQYKNLKDYSKLEAKKVSLSKEGLTIEDVCKTQGYAKKEAFSGYDYLPFTDNVAQGSTGHKSKNVDWESMMLYNSKAGGSGTATSGDDQRLPILLQSDGTLIPFNYIPTIQDINALETLYGLRQKKSHCCRRLVARQLRSSTLYSQRAKANLPRQVVCKSTKWLVFEEVWWLRIGSQ